MLISISLIVAGYLFGSLSTAVIVARLMGQQDPRTYGSKNPGATNVLRHGGKKAAAITLIGDCVKGVIPVLIAKTLVVEPWVLAATGAAAFLGHLYPIFFGFRGGKGVATALGVLLAISWPVGLATAATWLLMALLFKISSLSALVASLLSPAYMWWLTESTEFTEMSVLLTVLLIWRHRSNIQKLIAGTEGKISGDK